MNDIITLGFKFIWNFSLCFDHSIMYQYKKSSIIIIHFQSSKYTRFLLIIFRHVSIQKSSIIIIHFQSSKYTRFHSWIAKEGFKLLSFYMPTTFQNTSQLIKCRLNVNTEAFSTPNDCHYQTQGNTQ